jgi:hypothetical protein
MTRGGISASNAIKLYGAQLITYADDAHNKGSLLTTVLGASVKMTCVSIFSGGHMRFNKSAKYTDCRNPTSKGMVKNDYIRMGVYSRAVYVVNRTFLSSLSIDFLMLS